MVPLPAEAVNVPPVQVVETLGGLATTTPAGRLSVKSKAVASTVLAVLSIVKVSVLVWKTVMSFGEKLLLKLGGVVVLTRIKSPMPETVPSGPPLPKKVPALRSKLTMIFT